MQHLQPFLPRRVSNLPNAIDNGWTLKRYAILAEGRSYDEQVAKAATQAAVRRLPKAGKLADADGNHGIAVQLIHFAETAVVSPVFYWKWGMVLGHIDQMRAQWDEPTMFEEGVREVVGCIWEMDIVSFEIKAWKDGVLNTSGSIEEKVSDYLKQHYVA
ncbi:MAG: hypothetical protein AAFQ10_05225 [Pseudomonadota bacterium]